MLTDQDLSETVIALQHLDLAPETRHLVDEAARLLSEGREGEARALLEKAEALAALGVSANGITRTNGTSMPALQTVIAPLAAKLAEGFTVVLTGVLEDLHRYTGDQVQIVASSLRRHVEHLDTSFREVAGVGQRLEQRANEQQASLHAVQQAQDEIWGVIRALQQTGQEQRESLSRVAAATEELTHHFSNQVDAAASRFVTLEERVGVLDRIVQEMPAQLSGILARLDGHTEALRVLEQRHTHRVSTLNQVLDSLARLKEPEGSDQALPALA